LVQNTIQIFAPKVLPNPRSLHTEMGLILFQKTCNW